jgi:nitrite reductase/ring-hydroxylating ferredoxin subunit
MKRIIDYPSDRDNDFEDRNNTWRYVCRMKELPQGKSEQFTIRDEKQSKIEIAVFNVEGKFHAISNTCKHEGGPLSQGILNGKIVTCPWHGWKYSIIDGRAPHRGGNNVKSYETKIINDEEIYVNIIPRKLRKRVLRAGESVS